MRFFLTVVVVVLTSATTAVDIKVYPLAALAPEGARVTTHVVKDAANVGVRTIVDCDEFYRSTYQQIEGEKGPTIVNLLISQLPVGECVAQAILLQRDGKLIYSNRQQFTRAGASLGAN